MAQSPGHLRLSVVVPAFNEAGRIGEPLRRIAAYLRARALPAEVIVVDDGSTDGTAEVVRRIAGELAIAVRIVSCGRNRGKGRAVAEKYFWKNSVAAYHWVKREPNQPSLA